MTRADRGPRPRAVAELDPASPWCQRWTLTRQHSWRHLSEGGFDARRYILEPIGETAGRAFVQSRHYSGTWPAAARRYGLFDLAGGLLGVCVLGVPMSAAVLTNVFSDLEPMVEALELSRLVLADEVPGNAERWFIARVFADAAAAGVRGVVAFADPVPRVVDGRLVFPGHRGAVYMAKGATYLGRATPRTLTVLGNGHVLSDRSAQKVHQDERGHEHVERQLVQLGADPRRPTQPGAPWLAEALGQVRATRLRHHGNHRYAFRLGRTARERGRVRIALPSGPYPAAVDAVPPAQLSLFGDQS